LTPAPGKSDGAPTPAPPPARAPVSARGAGREALRDAPNTRVRDLGVLALVVLGPVWGYGWVATKVALGYSQPLTFAALRAALSIPCLFLVLVVARRPLRPPAIRYTLAIGLLQTTAFVGLVVWALSIGGAGKVAVLTYFMPFWLLLLARAFLGERLRGTQWFAVGLAFGGLLLVVAPWQLHGLLSSLLALAGGVAWAASALVVKLLQRHQEVDVVSLTTWQMVFGSLPLVAVAAITYRGGPEWTLAFTLSLSYTVLLANVLAWLLWLSALRALSAGAAGLGTLAIPVVGVIAAWLQLGERPDAVEAAGMVLIVSALTVLAAHGIVAGRREPAAGAAPAVQPLTD
jgi:drug/metabolite transporter (DMT)-like permease